MRWKSQSTLVQKGLNWAYANQRRKTNGSLDEREGDDPNFSWDEALASHPKSPSISWLQAFIAPSAQESQKLSWVFEDRIRNDIADIHAHIPLRKDAVDAKELRERNILDRMIAY